jgi:hypothetical protein
MHRSALHRIRDSNYHARFILCQPGFCTQHRYMLAKL